MTEPVYALEPDLPRNARFARWLLFRLLAGLTQGSLTVYEGAQRFHFGDPDAALCAGGLDKDLAKTLAPRPPREKVSGSAIASPVARWVSSLVWVKQRLPIGSAACRD